jgi:hypothetical protein
MSLPLTSATYRAELKSAQSTFKGVVVLHPGSNPSNTLQCVAAIHLRCETGNAAGDCSHLLAPEFNRSATSANSNTKMARLRAQVATAASAAQSSAAARAGSYANATRTPSKSSSSSAAASPPPSPDLRPASSPSVKMEYAPHRPQGSAVLTYSDSGPRITALVDSGVYFSDPLARDPTAPESHADRILRLEIWAFMKAACLFQQHLLNGLRIGDISGLLEAITEAGPTFSFHDTMSANNSMTTLTKKGKSWQEFSALVFHIRDVFDRETDPTLRPGVNMLSKYVLQAMEAEKDFAFEVTLLRKLKPDPNLLHIMSTLAVLAKMIGGPKHAQPALQGFSASSLDSAPASGPAAKDVCRSFKETGKCRFENPSKGFWCRHSHGVLDDARMKAKAAWVPKPASGGSSAPATKGRNRTPRPPSNDGCYRCGSKNHGVHACTEPLQAQTAQLPAAAAPVPTDTASTEDLASRIAWLELQARPPTSSPFAGMADPLGVGARNTIGLSAVDEELDSLFPRHQSR